MKNRLLQVFALLLLLGLLLGPAEADNGRLNVYIDATAPDAVGSILVYSFKEHIRASHSMEVVDDEKQALLQVHVVTLDPSANNDGNETVYSVVVTGVNFPTGIQMYLTSYVGICGAKRTDEVAEQLTANMDSWTSVAQAAYKSYLEDLQKKK